jgi:hypothetical protein
MDDPGAAHELCVEVDRVSLEGDAAAGRGLAVEQDAIGDPDRECLRFHDWFSFYA